MSRASSWTIRGNDPLAEQLRAASAWVDTPVPVTVVTEPGDAPAGAFALGPAALQGTAERIAPFYAAFEAVEAVRDAIMSGDAGRLYACFTSLRLPRGSGADEVRINALLPAIALTLDLLPGRVRRVWATRASLINVDDAWFVKLRYDDDVIATVETLATLDWAAELERDLLIEVTASEQVLRAEPMRQAVIVQPLGKPASRRPWWEDLPERYLRLVARRAGVATGNEGSRLRAVWHALEASAASGQPVML